MIINDLYNNKKTVAAEGTVGAKPGWMLKQDPELAKKLKDSKRGYEAVKKYAGKIVPKEQGMAEEYELAGVGVAYELGRQAYKQGKTIRDNPYSATKEARKYDEWEKGLERGLHDANDAKLFRRSVREQDVEENMNDDELAAMAKKVSPNAFIRVNGQEAQKPENYGRPYTPPPHDAEKHQRDLTAQYPNIDELVAKAEQRRDPNYNRADGDAYYRGRDAEQNYQKLKQIQRVIQGLNESQAPFKKNYLYEGLDRGGLQTVKLWESAGQRIVEAQLTADQINQLFTAAEQGATAAGGNRTMLGKGKDAAMAVNQAWEDLKTKVQNSGPIKSVDTAYDSAAEKLKQATGGDQGVMKYVQKYRDFAKAHPVAQSLIYSALIAAAGISGAGLGGAAALGLFKLVDKLLQGEKFSSAAYSGAKTGAMAYGASKVADYFRGPQTPQGGGGLDPNDPDVAAFNRDVADIKGAANQLPGGTGTLKGAIPDTGPGSADYAAAMKYANDITKLGTKGNTFESVGHTLSEADLYFIFSAATQLNEGIWDSIKGAAGKAADWAKTQGTNLTTKVTADKLKSAWTKAGSPTDSDQVYGILTQAGVAPQVLDTVYKSMNVPTFKEKVLAKPTTPPVSNKPVSTAPIASPTAQQPAVTPVPNTPNKGIRPLTQAPAGPPGFNAGNLAQLPGMAQYMKPQAKATPNYGGSTGYGKTTMSVNPMQAKTIKNAPAMAESLTWSQNFDPGRSLYRQMKQDR
jgi:hypothetical protein